MVFYSLIMCLADPEHGRSPWLPFEGPIYIESEQRSRDAMLHDAFFDVTTVAKILRFSCVNIAVHIAGKGEPLSRRNCSARRPTSGSHHSTVHPASWVYSASTQHPTNCELAMTSGEPTSLPTTMKMRCSARQLHACPCLDELTSRGPVRLGNPMATKISSIKARAQGLPECWASQCSR